MVLLIEREVRALGDRAVFIHDRAIDLCAGPRFRNVQGDVPSPV